jgi:putative ABC transport system permease protein
VIGWTSDTAFNGQGGLWADLSTWREVLTANRPGAVLADGVVQALVVRGSGSVEQTVAAVDDAGGGAVYALSIDDAIEEIPGVTEQRTTFNQILGVTVVIALVVIALFFALLTVERTALYGVLKAIGARSTTIPPGSIPLFISPGRIVTSIVLLLVAAVIGSAFSLRRVLRVDPASALGS